MRPARVCIAAFGATLAACSSGTGAGSATHVLGVSVSPGAAVVAPGATVQFQAEVDVAGASPGAFQTVRWSAASEAGGNPGTISDDGTYRAPSVVGDLVRIRATSAVDSTRWGEATVAVGSLSVAPAEATAFLDDSIQFHAAVGGAQVSATWTARLGTVDATGRYRAAADAAEAQDVVRASVGGATAEAIVTLQRRPPVLTAVSGAAGPGDTVTLTGTGFLQGAAGAEVLVLFPAASGAIAVPANASDTQATAVVPLGCSSGPVRIELRAALSATSNAVSFERLPRLRLHLDRPDVAAGDVVPLRVAVLGTPGPVALEYETDFGTIMDGMYTAPSPVTQTAYANVRACVAGTLICSGATLAVHPFVVDPSPAVVPAGGAIDLVASAAGAAMPATYSLAAGGGDVSPSGHYTASTALLDAGQAWLLASNGATQEPVQVGVTGSVPGVVSRMVDHIDHHVQDATVHAPRGTYVEAVAVGDGRAYVVGTYPNSLALGRHYFWIDVYDLSDPIRPRWVGAMESATRPDAMAVSHGRLYAWAERDSTVDGEARTLAVYDLSGALPRLILREATLRAPFSPWAPPTLDDEHLYQFGDILPGTRDLPVRIRVLSADPLATPRETKLSLPPDADVTEIKGVAARDGRAFVSYLSPAGFPIAAYDLVSDPPALLGSVDLPGGELSFAGPLLLAEAGTLFDVTGAVPAPVGRVPFRSRAVGGSGSRQVLKSAQSGLFILDTTIPATPRLAAALYMGLEATGSGTVVGNLLYSAEGFGGVAVYDVGEDGGLLRKTRLVLGAPSDVSPIVNAAVSTGSHVYATGKDLTGLARNGFLADWDLSRSPSEPGWYIRFPLDEVGWALALAGPSLLVGTAQNLRIFDLQAASEPQAIASLPIAVSCLAVDGPVAWVGTFGGDLVAVDYAAAGGPAELGRVALGATPSALDVLAPGRIAVSLVWGSTGDFVLVDGSSAATPTVVGRAGLGVAVYSVVHDGSVALVASGAGLVTLDVSVPSSPSVLALVPLPAMNPYAETWQPALSVSIALHDGIAWIGTEEANGAVHGFDVRNPLWPREVARVALGDVILTSVGGFVFAGTRGFAFGGVARGLLELDFTQPRNVVLTTAADRALQF
jgi:hypothetical protein